MLNVLIVCNNLNFVKYIINNISNINIHKIETSIDEALFTLKSEQIDLILINSSKDDILTLLNTLEIEHNDKYLNSIIAVSEDIQCFNNNPYIYSSNSLNDKVSLLEIIRSYLFSFSNDDIVRAQIINELQYLGYNTSYVGTRYISDIIYLMHNDYPVHNYNIKKNIYPILYKKYHKSYSNIKSNMSKATEIMYYECDENRLKDYLNLPVLYSKPRSIDIIHTVLNKICAKKIS